MTPSLEDYVDARALHPSYVEKECWNCGHTWLQKGRPGESICRECFQGQGDNPRVDEPTDYGELWYGDISLEAKREEYAAVRESTIGRRHVEVRL